MTKLTKEQTGELLETIDQARDKIDEAELILTNSPNDEGTPSEVRELLDQAIELLKTAEEELEDL